MPRIGAELSDQLVDFHELSTIVLGDRRVHLHGHPQLLQMDEAIHRTVEGARDPTEPVMRLGIRPIEADRHPHESRGNDPLGGLPRDQRPVYGQCKG